MVSKRAGGEEEWEGDGAVGPQVVKAFINYFSQEVGEQKKAFGSFNTSYQKSPLGSGDYPDKLLFHQALN